MSEKKLPEIRKSRELVKAKYLRVRDDELLLPDGRVFPHYYVIEFVDWVNVVALTKDRKIILIRQYRHAIGHESLEIPGGAMDGRKTEEPMAAAVRELTEETGYVPGEVRLLGVQEPNPALQSNRLWSFLALDCEKKFDQNLDEFEEIEVFTATIEEAYKFARDGSIRHSMVIAALHLAESQISKPEIRGT